MSLDGTKFGNSFETAIDALGGTKNTENKQFDTAKLFERPRYVEEVKEITEKNNREKLEIASQTRKEREKDTKLANIGENINFRDAIRATTNYIGKNEFDAFSEVFNLRTNEEKILKIKEIQKEAGFSGKDLDGIIGAKTLEYIYRNHYSKMEISKLPFEVRTRLELVRNLDGYRSSSKNPRNLPIVGIGNPFTNKYFKGPGNYENIAGTSINKELNSQLEGKLDSSYNGGNSIQIDKLPNGKYYLAMFVKGKLSVLTYVSPGDPGHRTPDFSAGNRVDGLVKHYISGSYPKRENGVNGGAVMPLAYEIDASRGIWGHVGEVTGIGASKGCVRAPGFYQQEIFNLLQKNGTKNFKVKTGKLY